MMGRENPSSSLGYGFFIVGFWIVAAVVLVFFLIKKIIRPKSVLDKIGVFMATPVLSIVSVWLILSFQENASSESYFNKGNYRYKIKTFHYGETSNIKRVEYYRSQNTDETWVKDSTWIYLSEAGDTIKRVNYKNDIEIK
jgi:hypothetical protein